MRHAASILFLLLLGFATAALQQYLTVSAPTHMWAGWVVDELLAEPSPADIRVQAPAIGVGRAASIGTRVDAVSALPPEVIASAASLRLERFRTAALAHPNCTDWTCRAHADAPTMSSRLAGWARDSVLRTARKQMTREGAATQARLERNAARASGALEILLRPLHLIFGITLVGACLSWWRGAPTWPFVLASVPATAAALAHQAVALTSFDLRQVQLEHLLVGAWALPAGLLGGVFIAGVASRWALVERLAAAWLSIGPGSAAWVRGGLLLAATFAWTWGPGLFGLRLLPAQQMEGVLAIASFALATFVACNLAWTEATGQSTAFGWPLVAVGVLAGSVAALAHGDGGALALTLGLALVWMFLAGPRAVWLPVAGMTVVVWFGWLSSLPTLQNSTAPMPALLETVVAHLPSRIGERVAVAWTPFGAGPSDVARVIGLVDLTGAQGFGFDPPLEGLAAGREADRRLLQLTADYMPAVLVAVYGAPLAGLLVVLHAGLLVMLALDGVRRCVSSGVSSTLRLLALWGVFGLFGAVLRVLLSVGGALGVLPLTGVPAPGLSLGTSAALAVGVMAGFAYAPAFWVSKGNRR